MVRAKFKYVGYESSLLTRSKRDADGSDIKDENGRGVWEEVEMRTLRFSPVFANNDPKHENSLFWRATPSGEVKLGTVNPEAWGWFTIGKEYHVDFQEAQ